MWLLYVSCAWVAGVFLGSRIGLPWLALFIGLIPFALTPFLPGSRKALIVAGLCLLAILGGIIQYPSLFPPADEHSLRTYNDKGIVEIQGMVSEEPDIRDTLCLLTFSASEVVCEWRNERSIRNCLSSSTPIPRLPLWGCA